MNWYHPTFANSLTAFKGNLPNIPCLYTSGGLDKDFSFLDGGGGDAVEGGLTEGFILVNAILGCVL
jgi:hypothetical protein